jgi:hypothetical protein
MSIVSSIRLFGDSATALPGFESEKSPFICVKPSEIMWNGMQTIDPADGADRQLFCRNAEINPNTSGLVEYPRWRWADVLAEISIEYDAIFIFAPHQDIFPAQMDEIVKAMVAQKTQYAPFLRQHDRKTGKLKSFTVKTENWFGGVGLIIWQCQQLLNKLDGSKAVSLTQLKSYFEQLSKRTRTVSIMRSQQLNKWIRDSVVEESFFGRLTGSVGKSQWLTFELGHQLSDTSEKDTLDALIDQTFKSLIEQIENKKLGFSRVVVSCNQEQLERLRKNSVFLQLDKMQTTHKFKWVHQPASVTSQILTGKDAIHVSYAVKEDS